MPVGHLRCAALERRRPAAKFVRLLVGRVDQHQAAPLLRRDIGRRARSSRRSRRLDARVAAQGCAQARLAAPARVRRRSAGPARRSQVRTSSGRAGIDRELAIRIERAHGVEIRREQRLCRGGRSRASRGGRCRPAIRRLRAASGPVEIVKSRAGMGVDDAEGAVLPAQMRRSRDSSACLTTSAKLPA